jgi:hypothetical protein
MHTSPMKAQNGSFLDLKFIMLHMTGSVPLQQLDISLLITSIDVNRRLLVIVSAVTL